MLSHHGMSLSFDSRASGYGRSDGCVVLMLEIAKPEFRYMSTIQAVNVNHGGRSVSLTAPNGVAHRMLLNTILANSPSLSVNYWEAHGTGTPLGDPIELNTLSAIFDNILIGSVKASLGHGEASAGTCGLLKIFMMLTNQYVPSLIHFHVLNKDIAIGTIRLPVVGEEADLTNAGISSFGVSGTNAAAIAFSENSKADPSFSITRLYLLPLSAKNPKSLQELEEKMIEALPLSCKSVNEIAGALANNRVHQAIRSSLLVDRWGNVLQRTIGRPQRAVRKDKIRLKLTSPELSFDILQISVLSDYFEAAEGLLTYNQALLFASLKFFNKISAHIEIVPQTVEALAMCLLADGTLDLTEHNVERASASEKEFRDLLNSMNVIEKSCRSLSNFSNREKTDTKLEIGTDIFDAATLLKFVGDFYINGYEIKWSEVYQPPKTYIPLPNYCFFRQSLWFEERAEVVDHYLVGTIHENNENETIMMNYITELRHPQLFEGPIDVGTIMEIAIETLRTQSSSPLSLQNMSTNQIVLTKPAWLKISVKKLHEMGAFEVVAHIDEQQLFQLTASVFEDVDEDDTKVGKFEEPCAIVHLPESPNAIVKANNFVASVDSQAETSSYRTAAIVLHRLLGFVPNPGDVFTEILTSMSKQFYISKIDDGALWQFQPLRGHKKSTLLSSQEASTLAVRTLHADVLEKVKKAFNDVMDSGIDLEEEQMDTGFLELGLDSLSVVDLLNRLNQKYFKEIELTTSDLFDNPNITDLSIRIEAMLKEVGITEPEQKEAPRTPLTPLGNRRFSLSYSKSFELDKSVSERQSTIQQEPLEAFAQKVTIAPIPTETTEENNEVDHKEILRKISSAVMDLIPEPLTEKDIENEGFAELGMDSLSLVDFVNRLNEKYFPGEEISTSDIFDYPTVSELAGHITRKKSMAIINAPVFEEEALEDEQMDNAYVLVEKPVDSWRPDGVFSSLNFNQFVLKSTTGQVLINMAEKIDASKLEKAFQKDAKIMVNLESKVSIEELHMKLLELIQAFSKSTIRLEIAVSNTPTAGNAVSKAFLKTVASEKYPKIAYIWEQRIQRVRVTMKELKIAGNWLITGGLSGIGYVIAKFLSENGVSNLVLVARRKPEDQQTKEFQSWKAKVQVVSVDVTKATDLKAALKNLNIPITGIIHSAGVLKDAKIERQTRESFNAVFAPKCAGFHALEDVCDALEFKLQHFIVMSSFTAACGNQGQLNYAVANAYLENEISRRRREGKPGCAIQWGNWLDTGMATNAHVQKFLSDLGFLGQHNEEALKYLQFCIGNSPEALLVANVNWERILKNRLTGKSKTELEEKLRKADEKLAKLNEQDSKCVLMFTGQGAQYVMMGRQLCEHFPLFRKILSETLKNADEKLGGPVPLWDILYNPDNYQILQKTSHMQPIMFCFGYAAAQLWLCFGVKPDFYLGHSVGELVAGVLAGIMTLEEGIELIVERGKAMENIAGKGAMLAVQREAADDVLRKFKVSIASVNSPKQIVVAGSKAELDKALAFVKSTGKQATYVNQSYPFHSNVITEKDLIGLRKCLKRTKFRKAEIPIISNVTGGFIDTFTEDYLVKHTVSAVKFVDCVETLEKQGVKCWLEAGPSSTLITFVKRIFSPEVLPHHSTLQTCKEKDSDVECVIQSALELERNGQVIDWTKIYGCPDFSTNLKPSESKEIEVIDFPIVRNFTITPDEEEILKDHEINGKVVVAGAYQLFKMNEFMSSYQLKDQFYTFSNAKFLTPWLLSSGKSFEIRWLHDMTVELVVGKVVTCSAKLTVGVTEHKPREVPEVVEPNITTDVPALYDHLYTQGLQYKNAFRVIEKMKKTDKMFWSTLTASSEHLWPLIDGSLHAMCSGVIAKWPDVYFVPVSMSNVYIIASFSPADLVDCRAFTVILSENEKFVQANSSVICNGRVVFEMKNMTSVVIKSTPSETSEEADEVDLCNTETSSETTTATTPEKSTIQIVGFDLVLPFGSFNSTAEVWESLKSNSFPKSFSHRKNTFENVSHVDVDIEKWDPEFFGIRPSEAPYIDPQQRLLLTSFARLLHEKRIGPLPAATGVFIGTSTQEFAHLVFAKNISPVGELTAGTSMSALAGRVSHWLRISGPTIVVDTACSSSFSALALACDAIIQGKCDAALVGTINLVLHEMTTKVLKSAGMIVQNHCSVFDASANGYHRSEAICTILITKDLLFNSSIAQILSWNTGHNGVSSSLYTPNGISQSNLMNLATNAVEVTDVEAHCTGTALGDPIEVAAIQRVLFSNDLRLSSLKSFVGHAEGSSGLVSLCITLLQGTSGYRLPQLHYCSPNPKIEFKSLYLPIVGEEINDSFFLVNNFGFTGANCSLTLKFNNQKHLPTDKDVFYLILHAADSSMKLETLKSSLDEIVQNSSFSLSAISIRRPKKRKERYRFATIYNYKRNIVWSYGDGTPNHPELQRLVNKGKAFVDEGIEAGSFLQSSNFFTPVPPLIFDNKRYWLFNQKSYGKELTFVNRKDIYFEKQWILKRRSGERTEENSYCIGELNGFNALTIGELAKDDRHFPIVIFPIRETTKASFLTLLQVWNAADSNRLKVLLICCQTNGTSRTEWTGAIRSLASEKMIPYKFICYEKIKQVYENLNFSDIFECIFYKENKRFVERLVPVKNIEFSRPRDSMKALVSGGSSGIGQAIINHLSPRETEVLSRREVASDSSSIKYKSIDLSVDEGSSLGKDYDLVVHCAGEVDNAVHFKMTEEKLNRVFDVKVNGAKALLNCCNSETEAFFASSAACILGSAGQSNYAFSNGTMTSMAELASCDATIVHWGPWKEVGMLSKLTHAHICKQLRMQGWNTLSNQDGLSIFNIEKRSNTQIMVFDGDFKQIVHSNQHLKPFLSEIVRSSSSPRISGKKSFDEIFEEITGIPDMKNKKDVPFMDLGLDSLCLERLRQQVNDEFRIGLTVAEIFNNSTFNSLTKLLQKRKDDRSKKRNEDDKISPKKDKVAIIGCSAAFSGSSNVEEFWKKLSEGKNCIDKEKKIGLINDANSFDYEFFNIKKEDAKIMDPQLRTFLQHAYNAIESSGYISQKNQLKCAVFAGAEPSSYGKDDQKDDTMNRLFSMNMNNYLASYTAYCLNLRGEAVSVYTACSTALVAIAQASQCLLQNRADLALAGAASLAFEEFSELNGFSDSKKTVFSKTNECRPLDAEADGIIRGSGVGCFVLKKLSQAIEDGDNILCVIEAVGISNDGNSKASFMAPNSSGQVECMNEALKQLSEKDQSAINYFECHATGTSFGDQIELASIREAYNFKKSLLIGSCKANIGHTFAAAGLASILKIIYIFKTELIPPQINFNKLGYQEENSWFCVNKEELHYPGGSAALNAFGIGGTNVHMVLSPFKKKLKYSTKQKSPALILLSAPTEEACLAQCQQLRKYLEDNQEVDIHRVAATLQFKREHFQYRAFVCATSVPQALELLQKADVKKCFEAPKVCFFFSPQGAQYSNMLFEEFMINQKSVFSQSVNNLIQQANQKCRADFTHILFSPNADIQKTEFAQVAVFIITISIFRQLQKWGIKADSLAGHSLGEYGACVASGSAEENSILELLIERAALCSKTEPASLIIVWGYFSSEEFQVEVSANLSPGAKCYVGTPKEIERLCRYLEMKGIPFKVIPTNHGYHSSFMDSILSDFKSLVSQIRFKTGKTPWISSNDGSMLHKMDAEYCVKQMRDAVNLELLVNTLIKSEANAVVEIGPPGILSSLLKERNSNILVVQTIGSIKRPLKWLTNCVGELWKNGVSFDFGQFSPKVSFDYTVPGYKFKNQKIWIESALRNTDAQYFTPCWVELKWQPDIRKNLGPIIVVTRKTQVDDFSTYSIYQPRTDIPHANYLFYIPSSDTDNLHQTFFDVQMLCKKANFKKLIVLSQNQTSTDYLAMGCLRDLAFTNPLTRGYFVETKVLNLEQLASIIEQNQKLHHFRILDSCIFGLDYCLATLNFTRPITPNSTAIVFGGHGYIGKLFCTQLKSSGYDVTAVSRSKEGCDITNYKKVRDLLKKYSNISVIVNCCGIETTQTIYKKDQDILNVLQVKTVGNSNILRALEECRIHLSSFVMLSSLSSIVPLHGNEDYSSANAFVNALALKGHGNVQRFVSLALPAITNSPMVTKSSTRARKMLETCFLTETQLNDVLKKSLHADGLLIIAPKNPSLIAEKALKFQTETLSSSLTLPPEKLTPYDVVRHIWAEALSVKIEEIQPESNFFGLGGDSLNVLQVIWKVEQSFGKSILIDTLFKYPELEKFVSSIDNYSKNAVKSDFPVSDMKKVPLTNSQNHMFLLRQLHPGSDYNIMFQLNLTEISPEFSWCAFRKALNSVFAVQEVFRTRFPADPVPRQEILSLTESFFDTSFHEAMENWNDLIDREKKFIFNIEKEASLRLIICKVENEIKLLFHQHHIITDGWSVTVLSNFLTSYYQLYLNGGNSAERLCNSFSSYASHEAGPDTIDLLEEYAQEHGNSNRSSIPHDKQDVTSHTKIVKNIPEKLKTKIRDLARQNSTTNSNIMLAAFMRVVRTHQDEDEVLIAYASAGRNDKTSNLIGYCMNNVLLAAKIGLNENFLGVIEKVRQSMDYSRKYEMVPYSELVNKLAARTDSAKISIYFNYRHKLDFPKAYLSGANIAINQISVNSAFDFSFTIDETQDGLQVSIEFNSGLYFQETIHNFVEDFLKLLSKNHIGNTEIRGFEADFPNAVIAKGVQQKWSQNWKKSALDGSKKMSFEEFQEQVENYSVALQLESLKRRGSFLKSDDIVAISMESERATLLIAACAMIGVPYSPIDTDWPEAKKLFVRNISQLDAPRKARSQLTKSYCISTPTDLAYVIFTSGSTGSPKGVCISRQSAACFVSSATKQCLFRPGYVVLDSVKRVFDVSVLNVFGCMLNCSTLYCFPKGEFAIDHLRHCNFAFIPSAVFNSSNSETFVKSKNLEMICVGGETVSSDILDEVSKRKKVVQIYGPTETCVWSTTNLCGSHLREGDIIGKPMENEVCTVLGGGKRGELAISGPKTARGYLMAGARGKSFSQFYKTGDIVKITDGNLKYLGRTDDQLKIRGNRIGKKEIENAISNLTGTSTVTIIVHSNRLTAFYVANKPIEELKNKLRHALSHYAIPDNFIHLDAIPLNSSGKIDRSKLLQILEQMEKTPGRAFKEVMINSVEQKVVDLASALIGSQLKLEDNFSNAGGHSLLAIKFGHQLSEHFGLDIKVHDVIQQPTLKGVAGKISSSLKSELTTTDTSIITKLRESPNSKFNVYLTHAIGGTIYPYYSFLQIFPKNVSVYGIEYQTDYPAKNVKELAAFYAKSIAAHAGASRVFLAGHSMGGILSREMIPFVMMFDSWVLRTHELDVEKIREFVTIKLAGFLRDYSTAISDTKLYLFKSKSLGEAAFKKAVRNNLSEGVGRSMAFNGFDAVSTKPIDVFLIDGDHETCLKAENLKKVQEDILAPFQPWL
ncbi:unnamed protein product [Caenorhabditis auriculariae]|uniref:Fatty acid synthase n=1 Tax=Caenorhabditis auriculariae TaxID=2777116 RepID=A0A8S1HIU6_9PELO|nr:unnamed protein product [Caenorhabditis auriculariae]